MEKILSGLLSGILIAVVLYFVDKNKKRREESNRLKEDDHHLKNLQQNPNDANSLKHVGKKELNNENVNAAITRIETVVADSPNDAESLVMLIKAYTLKGEFLRGYEIFEKIDEQMGKNKSFQLEFVKLGTTEKGMMAFLDFYEGYMFHKKGNKLKAEALKKRAVEAIPILENANFY